jgi:diadenosine tetraphosphatase ApaH/serine/threonine PP2A family protein phosphatase
MKFAVIADIHANLEAFQAVLEDSKVQHCTHYAFIGDIVGYNADPKECLDIVRTMNAPCVKGNHDEYCATDLPLDGFNPKAIKNVLWTRKQLTADDRRWLQNLPCVLTVEDFTIVHASFEKPDRWIYVFDKLAAATSFALQKTPLAFFGHTHVPMVFVRDNMVRGGTFTTFQVEAGKKYFVNVGAAGQPRDNNPKAAYVTYDMTTRTVELRRVTYDIATTQRKIRDAGLDT